MSKLLVTGSIAYDRISTFPEKFSDHILPKKIHNLNVCFMVNEMKVDFGGTGGNIAYNLTLLNEKPILMGSVGTDGEAYIKHLKKLKISTKYLRQSSKFLTANATIMTDDAGNQITSFYMGAMVEAHKLKLTMLKVDPSIVIISPNDPKAMIQVADHCFKKGIAFVADPGQTIPAFSAKELVEFITGSHLLVLNDYELNLLIHKVSLSQKEILEKTNYLIVTYGAKGAKVWSRDGLKISIRAYKAKKNIDPTGCGDAFRAGLMYGYIKNLDVVQSAKIGAYLGAKCVERLGTQNHKITQTELKKLLKKS